MIEDITQATPGYNQNEYNTSSDSDDVINNINGNTAGKGEGYRE